MACPFTPSPHGLCFSPSWVWSYTETNSQVPTISSLSDFCCWARVGKAKLIANPTRAPRKRIFIVFSWGFRDVCLREGLLRDFLTSPVTSVSLGGQEEINAFRLLHIFAIQASLSLKASAIILWC